MLIIYVLNVGDFGCGYANMVYVCVLYLLGRHLPDKAIDLVDEACANVRVQLDSQPEEIDNLERKRMQLEVELHALEKEKDKASKARLVDVSMNVEFFF
jgi:ATP-dependent Clp protease ATP-binding subunit ClpB